jgi:GntR family transcriptional regulator
MGSKHAELTAKLEARIASGEFTPGAELPSEAALVAQTGYARNTVRQAYQALAARGIIESSQGQARRVPVRVVLQVHVTRPETRVAPGQLPTRGADSWMHDAAELGYTASEDLQVRKVVGGWERELLRSVDGKPHNLATWWFPDWVTTGTALEEPASVAGGSIPYLETTEHAPDQYTVWFRSRMPTRKETTGLQIPGGVPVTVERRTGTRGGVLVVAETTIWPSDRTELIVEF